VAGFFLLNGAIVAVHVPDVVALQNTNEPLHFLIHVGLFVAGILGFLPVYSPVDAIPRLTPPMQMLYLFVNTIIPTVPASFLTFSNVALYPVYGDAGAAFGLTPIEDQTIAGLFMKLAGGFYLLGLIAAIWIRWIREERAWDAIERELAEPAGR
jgi:putative membrane protein